MATISEDYVSFETAKLLKEKGFLKTVDLRITQNLSFYDNIGLSHNLNKYYDRLIQDKIDFVAAPTLQMAMKWLREVHNLHIMVNCVGKVNYDPIVQRFDGKDFEIEGVEVGTTRKIDGKWVNVRRGFKTCEQATEAAIKYCLENLI